MSDHEETIRSRAYAIWERENRPEGRHADHWALADRELRDAASSGSDASEQPHVADADVVGGAKRTQDSGQATIKVTQTRIENGADRAGSTPI